ncbi:hypothetical protein DPMN_118853 [Dreissena polymorpha]|uniref:Uncharacterized protein n=1 Tax=Dreissena polymorpha TaxID=45954 RepID=A0A9D4GLG6_DREPO|nr:hypothetical protein DPMN_118853 [Dreissena polymorpha]
MLFWLFYNLIQAILHSPFTFVFSALRYEVAKLTSRRYATSFSPDNIISAFQKSGIYPFDRNMISETQTAPSAINLDEERKDATVTQSAEKVDTSKTELKTTTAKKLPREKNHDVYCS